MINEKNQTFKRFVNKKGFVKVDSNLESSLQNRLSSLIKTSNQEYFSNIAKKLSDPFSRYRVLELSRS